MPQTAWFLSGRFCQISIWILDSAFNKVNFYPDLDQASKNHYFSKIGTKRVNFGLLAPPWYSLKVCTLEKSKIYMSEYSIRIIHAEMWDKRPILHLPQLPFAWKLSRPVRPSYSCPWFLWTASNHLETGRDQEWRENIYIMEGLSILLRKSFGEQGKEGERKILKYTYQWINWRQQWVLTALWQRVHWCPYLDFQAQISHF